MTIKMNAVAAATAMILGTLSTAANADLLITEYVEGGSYNKAVEISNVSDKEIDLDKAVYKLTIYFNGGTKVYSDNVATLTGKLAGGKSLVFYNSKATAAELKVGTKHNVANFSGDDALVLTKDGETIDRIGKLGERKVWTADGGFKTQDKTLRRKTSITTGDKNASGNFPADANDWVVLAKDSFKGIGCPGEGDCSGSVTPPTDPDPEPEAPCHDCAEITAIKDPAKYNENVYYSDIINGDFKTEVDLKNALSAVIAKDHKQLTYAQVWTVLSRADVDPSNPNNVIELYTGDSVAVNSKPTWNREHVWAKSHGFPDDRKHGKDGPEGEDQLGYTDVHHLRPADATVNSTRGNLAFGECGDGGKDVKGGNCQDTTNGVWEPRDEMKGDVARMMFYMDTRYQGAETDISQHGHKNPMPDLELVNRLSTAEELNDYAPVHGTLCTLYKWAKADPVSDAEKMRNNEVYKYQGNRNPYIDDADLQQNLLQKVYGARCNDDPNPALVVTGDITSPESVTEGAAFKLDASALTAGEDKTLTFKWEQTTGEEKTEVGTDAVLSLTAPMVKTDTTLNFTLTIDDGTLETTKAVSVPVTNVPLTLDVTFEGNTKLTEGDSTSITATVADAPEGLSYSWKQVSGANAEFTASGLKLDVTAPQVEINQALVFELTASNDEESFSTTVSIDVQNTEEAGWKKPDGAGSFGGLMTLLLPLAWLRRRKS